VFYNTHHPIKSARAKAGRWGNLLKTAPRRQTCADFDLSLKPRPGLPAGVKGDEWQVRGDGFYHMMKYLVAPAQMPDSLTWFKWEATGRG